MSTSELIPLRFKTDVLDAYILSVLERKQPDESCNQKTSKVGMNVIAGIFSAASKVFYIPISFKLAAEIGGIPGSIVGITSAVCNSKAFFILEMWAARAIINDLLGAKTEEETELNQEKTSKCIKASIITSSVTVATLSQVPYALPAAVYSDQKILAWTVSLVASIFIPTRSIQLTLVAVHKQLSSRKKNQGFLKLKSCAIGLVKERQAQFRGMSSSERNDFIGDLSLIRTANSSPDEKINLYLVKMMSSRSVAVMNKSGSSGKYFDKAGLAIGIGLTGIFECAIAQYTYELTKEMVWDDDIVAGSFSGLVTGSCLYLYGSSIMSASRRVFNATWNLFTCNQSKGLGEQLNPGLSFFLKAEEVITNLFALGPSYIIWGDFYKEPTWEHWFFISSVSLALYFILITSSFDTIEDAIQALNKKGSGREIVETHRDFQRIAEGFEKSPQFAFAFTLKNLPKEIQLKLCEKISLTKDQFDLYIEEELKEFGSFIN